MPKAIQVGEIALRSLKPNPKNPRNISEAEMLRLMESINEFPKMMEMRPIIYDENRVVLGGNQRLTALKRLGYTKIPESWAKAYNDLNEAEKKRFIITDNRGYGEWDMDALISDDWPADDLVKWGIDLPGGDIGQKLKEEKIKPFTRTHVLISCPPETFMEIQDILQVIKNTDGVEFEQSSN